MAGKALLVTKFRECRQMIKQEEITRSMNREGAGGLFDDLVPEGVDKIPPSEDGPYDHLNDMQACLELNSFYQVFGHICLRKGLYP